MKKFVLKLELIDEKDKRKAFKTVSALLVDPVSVVSKLRKFWPTDIISIGPAKEPEKNKEPKKEEGKEETKGDQPTKDESKEDKKNEVTKKEEQTESVIETILPYYMPYYPPGSTYRPHYYPPMNTSSYYVNHSVEENPDACVIC